MKKIFVLVFIALMLIFPLISVIADEGDANETNIPEIPVVTMNGPILPGED